MHDWRILVCCFMIYPLIANHHCEGREVVKKSLCALVSRVWQYRVHQSVKYALNRTVVIQISSVHREVY